MSLNRDTILALVHPKAYSLSPSLPPLLESGATRGGESKGFLKPVFYCVNQILSCK